ncbi:TolB family protein [Draconibacterium halophilum]|uniref:Cytochrome C biosynthesis protein n=1 Tax=Draconibacterium halophilum TaxID=2706887 RepID=A0A6C0RC19_9BACT|nr:PD40 domain-containing protein [Draconibacterium halophilum]QIA07870.1 cytochrome C biosynthesis protein [Draconibacterium halophilum]
MILLISGFTKTTVYKLNMKLKIAFLYFSFLFLLISCVSTPNGEAVKNNEPVKIYPDYNDVRIPSNIAPLNFIVEEAGDAYYLMISGEEAGGFAVSSRDGVFCFSEKKWEKLLAENTGAKINYQIYIEKEGEWNEYPTFSNSVSAEKVDPFLYYRLLYPGYESWTEISIVQRSLESFQEKAVIENNVVGQNCVNCHAFNNQNDEDFMFHMRGNLGGTYFVEDGDLKKVNLKTKEMQNGAVYPRWHPSGKYVAFSSNKVVQQFHSKENKKIEVSDLNSSLVMYDVQKNEMMQVPVDQDKQFMDTYPEWSPDGSFLYFCRARQIAKNYDYRDIKYNLYRVAFNPEERTFAEPEQIFDAAALGKSVSFPRISPNGGSLVFTLHDYGCFSIWHKEADLYSVNLDSFKVSECKLNSEFTESYHSWSSNGRWLVFSSKRGDGLTARPYISYIDKNGDASKPFVLPQENPAFYKEFVKTFNIPEFTKTDVDLTPGEIREVANQKAVQAQWTQN